jgi:hypothetical protein
VGRAEIVLARDEERRAVGARHRAQGIGKPQARLCRQGLWLRDRSRLACSFVIALRARSGNQGGEPVGRGNAHARTCSPCATGRARAFATKPAHGGKSPRISLRSTV